MAGTGYPYMTSNNVQLDLEAQRLYEQLDGLEEARQFYINEQQQLNDWRRCMVEFTYLLARTLNHYRLSESFSKNEDDFHPLLKRLNRLLEIPQRTNEHKLIIRHRGLGLVHYGASGDEEDSSWDYVVSCGDCVIDKPYMDYLVRNKIIDDPALMEQMNKAFQFFALTNIYTIEINLTDWDKNTQQIISACMMSWARYMNDLAKDANLVVHNEANEPDPNLTILARLNRLKRSDLEKLIQQIHKRFMI
jgi:hypothetical protein